MTRKPWHVITLIKIFTCYGQHFEGKVVGGGFTAIKQFPHSVYLSAFCGDFSWGCGSSILTHDILLTAAHCLNDCSSSNFHVDAYAGTDDIEHVGSLGKYCEVNYLRRIKKFIIHEEYFPTTALCDIALAQLKTPLILGDTTQRVIIRRSFPQMCEAQMAGWGDISDDGQETFHLKRVRQLVRPSQICGNGGKYLKLRRGMMCASSENPDAYPASGDSGSALVLNNFQQIGIVSTKARGRHISSIVYTNVSFFYGWISHNSRVVYCYKKNRKR